MRLMRPIMNGAFPVPRYIIKYNKEMRSSLLDNVLPLNALGLLNIMLPEKSLFCVSFA